MKLNTWRRNRTVVGEAIGRIGESTSGGIFLGGHCVKAWSSTQGAIALSSAAAEFYAMVDTVLKAKWLTTVSQEMGMGARMSQIVLGTDSSAAKSFACRRGSGRMRHIEIRVQV